MTYRSLPSSHPHKHLSCRLVFQMRISGYILLLYIMKLSIIAFWCPNPLISPLFFMKNTLSSWSPRFKTTDSSVTPFSSLYPTLTLFFVSLISNYFLFVFITIPSFLRSFQVSRLLFCDNSCLKALRQSLHSSAKKHVNSMLYCLSPLLTLAVKVIHNLTLIYFSILMFLCFNAFCFMYMQFPFSMFLLMLFFIQL